MQVRPQVHHQPLRRVQPVEGGKRDEDLVAHAPCIHHQSIRIRLDYLSPQPRDHARELGHGVFRVNAHQTPDTA